MCETLIELAITYIRFILLCGIFVAHELLAKCDVLRDDQLPSLGVILEDQDGRTVVKYVGREAAQREKEKKEKLMEEKRRQKEEAKKKQEEAKVSL